jgi:hypothetical protein
VKRDEHCAGFLTTKARKEHKELFKEFNRGLLGAAMTVTKPLKA